MNSCNVGLSYSATLTTATSIKQWSCQQRRRRVNRSSLCNSRHISALVLCTNWCSTICITCPILREIECIEFICNEFVLVLVQIDLPFSSDWNHHIKLLAIILCWLRKNGFTIGPFTQPSEWLTGLDNSLCHDVYILEKENIDAILHMDWPCNATELCMFIGYVNYYHTCCRVVHISLHRIDPQFDNLLHGQIKCRKHLYNAYAYTCKSIACPDHNKWFSIHPNASDFQLGMCII